MTSVKTPNLFNPNKIVTITLPRFFVFAPAVVVDDVPMEPGMSVVTPTMGGFKKNMPHWISQMFALKFPSGILDTASFFFGIDSESKTMTLFIKLTVAE